MLNMWPYKIIFHIQLLAKLFTNPTHKTKTGIASRWETTNRLLTNQTI